MDYNLQSLMGSDLCQDNITSQAMGDQHTLLEANGDRHANAASMRRADISVVVTEEICDTTDVMVTETYDHHIPRQCESTASDEWAIKLSLSGGGTHAGVGGAFALGELKNKRTGKISSGEFIGGGIGVGASTPGADPGWGSWTHFTTEGYFTFDDFDNTLCRLTTAGGGVALLGYSAAFISFPWMGRGAQSIYVGGFNMGQFGLDAGTNVGAWNVDHIPAKNCTPERIEERTREKEITVPHKIQSSEEFSHTVYFETGSSDISSSEIDRLDGFAEQLSHRIWQWKTPLVSLRTVQNLPLQTHAVNPGWRQTSLGRRAKTWSKAIVKIVLMSECGQHGKDWRISSLVPV